MAERFNKQLKAAITAISKHIGSIGSLPMVLLGIRCTLKKDLSHSPAQMVYGLILLCIQLVLQMATIQYDLFFFIFLTLYVNFIVYVCVFFSILKKCAKNI